MREVGACEQRELRQQAAGVPPPQQPSQPAKHTTTDTAPGSPPTHPPPSAAQPRPTSTSTHPPAPTSTRPPTHRDVVAHEVQVALPRVELDGKAAGVAQRLGAAALVDDCGEAGDEGGLHPGGAQEVGAGQVAHIVGHLQAGAGAGAVRGGRGEVQGGLAGWPGAQAGRLRAPILAPPTTAHYCRPPAGAASARPPAHPPTRMCTHPPGRAPTLPAHPSSAPAPAAQRSTHLEEALCRGAARVHHPLRDALPVKVGQLLHQLVVLQQDGACMQ